MEDTIKIIEEFNRTQSFNTRGLPFAKKMWRDGYNKAIQDIITHLKLYIQENRVEQPDN